MSPRHLTSWKTLFYEVALPLLRRVHPARAEAVLERLGRWAALLVPGRRRALDDAAQRARIALGPAVIPDRRAFRVALAERIPQHLARDYLIDGLTDAALNARFEVEGLEPLQTILRQGRGAILLGSHFGAHLAGLHWMIRQDWPLRLLVQRPRHVSATLTRWFDRVEPRHPQANFFLRRNLAPSEAILRVLRARDALRDGLAVYLNGDIPWTAPSARPGTLLGRERTFLAVWADLAALVPAPVIPVFCNHLPGGRYRLTFDLPFEVGRGGESEAVSRYLAQLDARITNTPLDAIPHLTWPAYNPPESGGHGRHIDSAR